MGQWSAFECLTTLWRSFVFGVDEGKDMLGRRSFQGVLRVKTPPAHRLTCPETNTETFPPALESILPTCNDKLSYAPSFFFPSVDLMSVQPKPQAINSNLVAKPTADTTAPSNAQESVLMDTKPSAYPSPPMAPLATATSGTAASTAAYFNSTTLQVAMEPTPCAPFGESPTSAEAEAVQAEASPLGQSHIPFEAPHTIVTTSHTQEVQNESVIPSLTGVAGSTILSEPVTSVAFTNITSIVRKTSTVQLTQDRQPCLNAIAAGSSAISGSQEKVTKKRKCSASSTDTPTGFQRSQTSVRAATIASSDAYTHEEKVIKKSKCSASSIEGQPSSQACQAHVCATVVASTPVDSEEVVIKKESSTSAETQSSSQSRRAIVGSRKLSIKKEPITFTETPTTDFKPIIDTGSSNTVSARRPARSTPSKERSRATLWLPTKKALTPSLTSGVA
ncbi:hypothetical protein BC829DRAFT_215447 [Chytridium lagenaria]|nr:hypothetical protein BC829DRAFT_215447 [Chytridium lagenaria]